MHPRMLSIEQVTKSGDWSFYMTVEMYQILPKLEKLKLLIIWAFMLHMPRIGFWKCWKIKSMNEYTDMYGTIIIIIV